MTYGIFNLNSGNLIESYRSERRALELVAEMLQDDENEADTIGLVVSRKRRTIRVLAGEELRAAVAGLTADDVPSSVLA